MTYFAENRLSEFRTQFKDEELDHEKLLRVLCGACKICTRTYDTRLCSEILINYGVFGNDVDGFLKYFMAKIRRVKSAALLYSQFEALKLGWEQRERKEIDIEMQAGKFALSFGVGSMSFDPLILSGMDFALRSSEDYDFLNKAVMPFVKRSSPSASASFRQVFNEKVSELRIHVESHEPLIEFRDTLSHRMGRKRKDQKRDGMSTSADDLASELEDVDISDIDLDQAEINSVVESA